LGDPCKHFGGEQSWADTALPRPSSFWGPQVGVTYLAVCLKNVKVCPSYAVAYAENFHGAVHWVAYGGHLYLVCAVCDVTIWLRNHVSKPLFRWSLL